MLLSRTASWILLALAAAAPWFCGARMRIPNVLWIFGALISVAFLLVCVERARESRRPQIPRGAAWIAVFLVGCLGWWLTQPEPDFATAFSASHWRFLELWNPAGQLQFPRVERFFFLASVLLGFVTVADLGRRETFRHRLLWTLSLSGIAVALYSVGQRWMNLPPPPWLYTSGGLDGFSSTYFNYSAAAAGLNFAWPWLIFGSWQAAQKTRRIVGALALAVTVAALAVWPATSGWGVAAILFAGGAAWKTGAARFGGNPRWMLGGTVFLFAAAFLWQANALIRLRADHPDNWMGVEMTRMSAETRDEAIRAASLRRSDRLAPSSAPPLPSVWLAALRMGADHPLLGNGPGSWVRESALYSNDPLVNTFFHMRQFAHHDLLQTAAEWGVVPALGWLFLWAGAFYRAARRNGGSERELALVLMLTALALHSLVHFPLQVPALQLWGAMALGLAWRRKSRRRTDEPHDRADEAGLPQKTIPARVAAR